MVQYILHAFQWWAFQFVTQSLFQKHSTLISTCLISIFYALVAFQMLEEVFMCLTIASEWAFLVNIGLKSPGFVKQEFFLFFLPHAYDFGNLCDTKHRKRNVWPNKRQNDMDWSVKLIMPQEILHGLDTHSVQCEGCLPLALLEIAGWHWLQKLQIRFPAFWCF